jgi:hypothetical protein
MTDVLTDLDTAQTQIEAARRAVHAGEHKEAGEQGRAALGTLARALAEIAKLRP